MSKRPRSRSATQRGGFTIVEVIVAVIVLAAGVVGMAGTTVYVIRQVTLADLTSKRALALQQTIETLRARNYTSLSAGSDTVDVFEITWTVQIDARSTEITLITTGPGLTSAGGFPMLAAGVADTFVYRIVQN